jgi:hypothetical protein
MRQPVGERRKAMLAVKPNRLQPAPTMTNPSDLLSSVLTSLFLATLFLATVLAFALVMMGGSVPGM